MGDRDFLIWIRDRLIHQHGENENVDYMHKLTSIINDYDSNKLTPNLTNPVRRAV